ncbi:MAG: OmpH family outer membrane protein [Planctomycetes bacterium]|nr:OmpH family outer membrane protein [Planctomycetota bacterium]
MNRLAFVFSIAGLVVACLLPRAAAGAPEVRIAICNLSKLYSDCHRSKDKRAELEALRAEAEGQLKEYQQKIEECEKNLPLLEKGSQPYNEKVAEREKLRNEGEAKKRVERDHLERKFADFLKEFYDYAAAGIREVARQQGYTVVLQTSDDDLAKLRRPELLLNRVFTQGVLYADEAIDITDEVMKKLDADYVNAKHKGEAAQPQ